MLYDKQELSEMISARHHKMRKMADLRNELVTLEYEVIQQLMLEKKGMYLKVDWTRLARDEADSKPLRKGR